MFPVKNLNDLTSEEIKSLLFRFGDDFSKTMTDIVIPIVQDVRTGGDEAVKRYTKKFDNFDLSSVIATPEELEEGYKATSPEVIASLKEMIANITEFHEKQKRTDIAYSRPDGSQLGIKYQPIDSAAIYVPGGKAAYPSSVLMGIIPAQIAGVKNITLITPPRNGGKISDAVAAACHLLGVKTVLKSGGAQGIAAAAFGTESVPKSEIIVGPGNIFVTAAKSYLFSLGVIQIDSLAGPSEVLIIADKTANPKWVAWDLLSQAEHEENATALLLTDSPELARAVNEHITEDIESGRGRSEIKRKSVSAHALTLIVDSIDEAVEFANRYAAEHMQVMTKDPMSLLPNIRNVGSLFLGSYSPVPVGDYYSGTNHILPTGGAARFSSGLSVETFLRRMTWQNISEAGLKSSVNAISTVSAEEGFDDKHGGAVRVRFE